MACCCLLQRCGGSGRHCCCDIVLYVSGIFLCVHQDFLSQIMVLLRILPMFTTVNTKTSGFSFSFTTNIGYDVSRKTKTVV